MRRTFNASLMYENGKFVGVNLGTYVNQCDCSRIQEVFDVDNIPKLTGGFCVSTIPQLNQCTLSIVKFKENGMEWAGLYFDGRCPYDRAMTIKDRVPKPIVYEEDEICSAWGENEFGIVLNKKYAWVIDDLLTAIIHNDLIIEVGDPDVSQNQGLCLLIASNV